MSYVLDHDAEVEFIDIDSPEGEDIVRHSTAHLMAQAVLRLYPETKVTIGPVIENGFYYDFDPVEQFTEEDLEKIEAEMKRIVKENIKLEKYVLPKAPASADSAISQISWDPIAFSGLVESSISYSKPNNLL